MPVQFSELCIELDVYVVRDIDCHYDLLIGRNAIQHSDIEIVTDSVGSRLVRKHNSILKINFLDVHSDDQFSELTITLMHLDKELQNKIKAIFQKYPSVLDPIGNVRCGELEIK